MKNYTLSTHTRHCLAFLEFHENSLSCIKHAIIKKAYKYLGQSVPKNPEGIYKSEGGVTIMGKEIAIKKDYVADDWNRSLNSTPEENAVVHAIEELSDELNRSDMFKITKNTPKDHLSIFGNIMINNNDTWINFVKENPPITYLSGDPLRKLCGV